MAVAPGIDASNRSKEAQDTAPFGQPTLLLHVGRGKTGTSTLQSFLAANRKALAVCGWDYPPPVAGLVKARSDGEHAGNIAWLARGLSGPTPEFLRAAGGAMDKIFSGARNAGHNVILSSEVFYRAGPRAHRWLRGQAAAAGFRVVVLCAIREQLDFLISSYAQQVKKRTLSVSLEEYLQSIAEDIDAPGSDNLAHLDYTVTISEYEDIYGKDNIIIRIFEPSSLWGGDIRLDFLKTVKIPEANFEFGASENVSASARLLELLWRINRVDAGNIVKNSRLLKIASAKKSSDRTSPYDLVSEGLIARIRAGFAQSNEQFRQTYFPDRQQLFSLRTGSGLPVAGISDDELSILLEYFSTVVSPQRAEKARARGQRHNARPVGSRRADWSSEVRSDD